MSTIVVHFSFSKYRAYGIICTPVLTSLSKNEMYHSPSRTISYILLTLLPELDISKIHSLRHGRETTFWVLRFSIIDFNDSSKLQRENRASAISCFRPQKEKPLDNVLPGLQFWRLCDAHLRPTVMTAILWSHLKTMQRFLWWLCSFLY